MTEPYVRRRSWDRWDKLWWFGSTVFYGLPCGAALLGSLLSDQAWVAVGIAVLWVAFGVFNWRFRARASGKLLAEITTESIRFRDVDQPVPWSAVESLGFVERSGGTWALTEEYVVLLLAEGGELYHKLDDEVFPYEIRREVARLAPQVPIRDTPS
ncbi:hypothetical protein WEI85_28570 [Actinomycetes bacterium KLBMP 9797]